MNEQKLWNLNIHFDAFLARFVSAQAQTVLDVGCGDGFLAAMLAERVPQVIGLDHDFPVLQRAKTRFPNANVTWIQADLLDAPFADNTFDVVLSNATLHHCDDAITGLLKLRNLVRPSGMLAIVSFAQNSWYDWPFAFVGAGLTFWLNLIKRKWEHSAPQKWPPAKTYSEMHAIAKCILPNVRYTRHLLGRYSLVWHKPAK